MGSNWRVSDLFLRGGGRRVSREAEDDWVRAVGAFKEENGGTIKTLSTLQTITSCQCPSSQS